MTPKELLKEIKSRHQSLYDRYYCTEKYHFNENNKFLYDDLEKYINELETLKKPPTVDEVCKALSEQLKLKVSYGAKQFYYKIENTKCIMFVTETYGDGLWSINDYLPPYLITIIGRFYEGSEVKE